MYFTALTANEIVTKATAFHAKFQVPTKSRQEILQDINVSFWIPRCPVMHSTAMESNWSVNNDCSVVIVPV